MKDIDCAFSQTPPNKQTKPMTLPDVPPPNDDELSTLFRGLHESDTRPVILSFKMLSQLIESNMSTSNWRSI